MKGWQAFFKDHNIDERVVLRRAGLADDLFVYPERNLSTDEYYRLWESMEKEMDDPLLPLHILNLSGIESFIPHIFAAFCCTNFIQAMQRLSKYKKLISPLDLECNLQSQETFTVTLRWFKSETPVPLSIIITELAFLIKLIRQASREKVLAKRVSMPNIPGDDTLKIYEEYFGTNISVGDSSLELSYDDVHRPFLTANEEMWRMFEPDLRRRLNELDRTASLADRVNTVLLELLPSGEFSADCVAKRLSMSKRTLQRKLAEDKLTFRELVTKTRERLARYYLIETEYSVTDIALLLGFDDPNSFYRAFHDWTGETTSSVRKR